MNNTQRNNGQHRVVVTGMAIISPLGTGIARFWEKLSQGQSGIRRITQFDPAALAVQIAGEVPDFDPLVYMGRKDARILERSSQFAIAATHMVIQDAGLTENGLAANTENGAVVMGTAFGGYDALQRGIADFRSTKRPNPRALVNSLTNMPTFHVAQTAHVTGPNSAITTACAAGTQAIGDGAELIRRGRVQMAFVGGVEALIQDYAIAAFDSMTSLARGFNDNPTAASRPFDADRAGFVFSEGCALLLLESLEHAAQRGARMYAEILGHATSNDAYHPTAIEPAGLGARRVMQWALDDAAIDRTRVGYVNAHGTSTRSNDPIETAAIKHVLGSAVPVSSTKSMTGHSLGAAGAIEAVATILALHHQCLPPTINYSTPDPACDLDYVPNSARDAHIEVALSNSFGLGGHNATVVFGRV